MRLSAGVGEVGRRKRGLCLMRSVKRVSAVSGEWARLRREWAMCGFDMFCFVLLCGELKIYRDAIWSCHL